MPFQQSPEIGNLATALNNFQSEVKDLVRDTQAHNYLYADLGQALDEIRPKMGTHGLALAQFPIDEGGHVGCHNILMHTSGEWMAAPFMLQVTEGRGMTYAQASGSVLSYCRRYSALSILGLTQKGEDSDAVIDEPVTKTTASDEQYNQINEHIKAGDISKRRLTWLQVEKNWLNLTYAQAEDILAEIKRTMK